MEYSAFGSHLVVRMGIAGGSRELICYVPTDIHCIACAAHINPNGRTRPFMMV